MNNGFIKCAALLPKISVANTAANSCEIIKLIKAADARKVNLAVFPELCVTSSCCGDLFYSNTLLSGAIAALQEISASTIDKYPVVVVGLPIKYDYKIYNCAAVIHSGEILGLIPKNNAGAQFANADSLPEGYNSINIGNDIVPISKNLIFRSAECDNFRFGIEIGSDLFATNSSAKNLCESGATIIANCAAMDEIPHAANNRRIMISAESLKLSCGYIYSNAFLGESTGDLIFSGHSMICENGIIIEENLPFNETEIIISEIDADYLTHIRSKRSGMGAARHTGFTDIYFNQPSLSTEITRKICKNPFIPGNNAGLENILTAQAYALKKRIEHTNAQTLVIGISGGLDSCLALLAAARSIDLCGKQRKDIIAVTMPCFGTTSRTKNNAELLCNELGVTFKTVDIKAAVSQHFEDIGHDKENHNITFENAQARERTQVLMDIANSKGGLVIGTGDLSELALGWATYNGDQMSMYGINASIPKTLVRALVKYEAERLGGKLSEILCDIINTPVSPELLPAEGENIKQVTEDLVGPYELHDFFIYYFLKCGFSPKKLYRIAVKTFEGEHSAPTILKWLKIFFKRFFISQFKRTCMPDGAKITEISLSPRGGLEMPSDAAFEIWMSELEDL